MFSESVKEILSKEVKIKKFLDRKIFDEIYDKYVASEEWKKRTKEERDEIFSNYFAFEINGVFVGSAGLTYSNGEIYLQCLHVEIPGNGIGKTLVGFVKEYGFPIVTYSKKEEFFEKCGFVEVPGEFSSSGAKKYRYKK